MYWFIIIYREITVKLLVDTDPIKEREIKYHLSFWPFIAIIIKIVLNIFGALTINIYESFVWLGVNG
jgi:hypothetical protein